MPRFLEFTVPAQLTGSITVPGGSTRMIAEAVGGGGAGTAGGTSSGGGGGGAYARSTVQVSSNQIVYFSIPNVENAPGGTSATPTIISFNENLSNPIVQAAGGSSTLTQIGGAGGTIAASIGDVRFAGGNGGNGQTAGGNRAGGGGGAAGGPFGTGGNGTAGAGTVFGLPGLPSGGSMSVRYLSTITGIINDVIFANNIYVACTETGIFSSTDSITWTSRQTVVDGTYRVVYTGTNFVVLSASDTVYTSTNGTTWTARTPNQVLGRSYNYLAHNGAGFLIAVGSGGAVMTSPDHGVTWTQRTAFPNALSFWQSAAYFSVTGFFYASSNNGLMYSTSDGINWTPVADPYTNLVQIDNFLFGCLNSGNTLYKTSNVIDFTQVFSVNSGIRIIKIFKTPLNKYIIATESSVAYVSFDTNSWYELPITMEISAPGSATQDFIGFNFVIDFFGTNPALVYRFTLTKNAMDINDVGREVNYAKLNLIPGGEGGTPTLDAFAGGSNWNGSGAGGGGYGTNTFSGSGSDGIIRIHFNPRRKIVS